MADRDLNNLNRILKEIRKRAVEVKTELSSLQRQLETTGRVVNIWEHGGRSLDNYLSRIGGLQSELQRLESLYKSVGSAANKVKPSGPPRERRFYSTQFPTERTVTPTQKGQERVIDAYNKSLSLMGDTWRQVTADVDAFGNITVKEVGAAKQSTDQLISSLREQLTVQEKINKGATAPKSSGDIDEGIGPKGGKDSDRGKFQLSPDEIKRAGKEYRDVISKAEEYGFTLEDLQKVSIEASNGQRRFTFGMRDQVAGWKSLNLVASKSGEILVDTQRRFKTMGAAIARNIQEVFKWAVAAQLVWVPMRKLQDIMGEMIQLQGRLAQAAIATGQSFDEINTVFEEANQIAQDTGSAILGVVEGYELAFRASGSYRDATERSAVATQLLSDAMILSRVSTLDESEAIDTLVGGLRQLGLELTEGQVLLDKWVATSKEAGVAIESLAESFAITSASADNAGIEIDRLNGYLGVLGENTTLTASEIGNAMRAFVTGYQTDNARKELRRLGIAIENTKGEALDFNDVIFQIYDLWDAGELSDAQLNRLAVAIGGGNRRATQFITILENLNRVQEISSASTKAHGDAQEALAKHMQTVQSSLKNLENAFKRITQTIGTEGGFLGTLDATLKLLTRILNTTSELTEAFGSAIPVLTAFGVAFSGSIAKGKFGDISNILSERAVGATQGIYGTGLARRFSPVKHPSPYGLRQDIYGGGRVQPTPSPALLQGVGRIAPSAGLTGIQGLISILGGEKERGFGQLAGGAAGIGLAGAAGLGTGGTLIAAQIGSMIVGTMSDAIWDYQSDWEEFFSETMKPPSEDEEGYSVLSDMTLRELRETRDEIADELTGGFLRDIGAWLTTAGGDIGGAFGIFEDPASREEIEMQLYVSDEDKEHLELIQDLIEAKEGGAEVSEGTTVGLQFLQAYSDELEQATEQRRNLLKEETLAATITSKEYKDLSKDIEGFGNVAAQIITGLGEDFLTLGDNVLTTEESIDLLFSVLYHGSEEQVRILRDLSDALYQVNLEIEKGGATPELESRRAELQERLRQYIPLVSQRAKAQRVQIPAIIDFSETDERGLNTAIEYAQEEMSRIWESMPDELKEGLSLVDWKNSIQPFLVELEDGTYRVLEGVTRDALKSGLEQGLQEGDIAEELGQIGVADYRDRSIDEIRAAGNRAANIARFWQDQVGYEPQFEQQLVLTKEGFSALTLETQITNLILKDILDTQEEQLEGIYNLPADMSFYVPFSGYALGQGGGGGGGLGNLTDLMNFLGDWRAETTAEDSTPNWHEDFSPGSKKWLDRLEENRREAERIREQKRKAEEQRAKDTYVPDMRGLYGTDPVAMAEAEEIARQIRESYEDEFNLMEEVGEASDPWGMMDSGGIEELREGLLNWWKGLFGGGTDPTSYQGGTGAYKMASPDDPRNPLQKLIDYFRSGQFYNDAMNAGGGGLSNEESFDKVLDILAGLDKFNFYDDFEKLKNLLGVGNQRQGTTIDESVSNLANATQQLSEVGQMRLDLEITSNTTLALDGQVVANSVKSYLAEDLVAQETASGDVAKSVVI